MRKIALLGLFLLAMLFVSCEEEGSAEIIVNCTSRGQAKNVWVEVYNSNGVQIQQVSTDRGIGYIKDVSSGTYTLKFKGHDDQYFSAVKVVKVQDKDSKPVKVDLDAPPEEGGSV